MPHNPPPNTKPHAKLPFARRQLTPHPAAEPASRIARCPVLLVLLRRRAIVLLLAPLGCGRVDNGEDCGLSFLFKNPLVGFQRIIRGSIPLLAAVPRRASFVANPFGFSWPLLASCPSFHL